MKRNQWTGPRGLFLSCSVAAFVALLSMTPANAALFSDDFETNWPYSLDLANGIWTGTHNMANLNGGLFESNPDGQGQLVIDNLQGSSYGWSGGDSNAPLVYFDVDGAADWTAQVTIDAQTSIPYSGAGFVARAKTGVTPGPGSLNDFIAFYSFRYWDPATDPLLADNGSTLLKRIENGVQVQDTINPGFGTSLPDAALPNMLRLVRSGNSFTGYISLDDGATWLNQGTATVSATSPLADPNVPIEFGLTYQNFTDLPGQTRFDDFSLRTTERIPEPTTAGLFVIALLSFAGVIRRRSA
jgi:hypothetical protein